MRAAFVGAPRRSWVRAHCLQKSVGAQIEDPGDHGQEGAPRRGGGPRGRPLHHFLAPDGATYV